MAYEGKTYTIEEAKKELHKVVLEESKKLEKHLAERRNNELVAHY